MKLDIYNMLENLDHGQLADLVSNVMIVELVDEVQKGRGDFISRGRIIADSIGGAQVLLLNPKKRNQLFLSLDRKTEDGLKQELEVESIYDLRMSRSLKEKLFHIFNVEHIAKEKNIRDRFAVGAVDIRYGLFQHQSIALLEAIKGLNSADRSVLLHMPTGAGKTRTAMHLVARVLNTVQGGIVVWLVHGIELCRQAASEFRNAWECLGERPLPIIEMWDGKDQVSISQLKTAYTNSGRSLDPTLFEYGNWPIELSDAFIVASVDSMNSLINKWQPNERRVRSEKVELIIFDEAHQAIAETYKRAIESVRGSKTKLLGLSATPGREDLDQDEQLRSLFKKKIGLKFPSYKSPVEALISQGYLARLKKEKLQVVNSNISQSEVKNIRRKLSTELDINDSFLKIVGLDAVRNLQIVKKVEEIIDEGHLRIIVFAPSVESSNLLSNIMSSMGINAKSITANTSFSLRNDFISEYKSAIDIPIVLCNFGVLTTGFDAPATSSVIIARPTTSIVLLSQMAGRAIRGKKVGGNEYAKLVTVVDTTIPELVDTVEQFHAFDELWIQN